MSTNFFFFLWAATNSSRDVIHVVEYPQYTHKRVDFFHFEICTFINFFNFSIILTIQHDSFVKSNNFFCDPISCLYIFDCFL